MMRWGVVTFPGSLDDNDILYALEQVLGEVAVPLWHKDRSLHGVDCVVLPGGFSYGDYLRAGALARFSPVMDSVVRFAADGGLVFGICNGFQVLCETGLLPGALLRNQNLHFGCDFVHLRVERATAPFTSRARVGQVLRIPIKNGEGNYFAAPQVLAQLEAKGQVALRYCDENGVVDAASNPNGSLANIAGIANERGNVFGLMPHPEHAVEAAIGGTDGLFLLGSLADAIRRVDRSR